jgi:RNA polymerase sigma-70 factor (ECF subfamily)
VVKSHKFPVTRWSLIIAFQQGDEAEATLALEDLCQTYWYPLYAHARRSKQSPEEAEDLTQAFQ